MEKEPRRKRRGLDSETLSTLESTGPEYLTTTASAHTAKEAVNLLILAVVRLERALQRVHPLTIRQGKHTRDYNPARRWTSSQSVPPLDRFTESTWARITFSHRPADIGDSMACPCSARLSREFRAAFFYYTCPHTHKQPVPTLHNSPYKHSQFFPRAAGAYPDSNVPFPQTRGPL